MWIWYVLTGFLSGIISGMGIGGGAVLIPALSFVFDMGQREAQNINLLFFLPTAAIAIVTHKNKGNIEKKGLPLLIGVGLAGAGLGAAAAMWIDAALLRKGFALFLLGMGIYEFTKGQKNMELKTFEKLKTVFRDADTDTKISMYVDADGLTQTQYKELLRMFPLNELHRLEEALG